MVALDVSENVYSEIANNEIGVKKSKKKKNKKEKRDKKTHSQGEDNLESEHMNGNEKQPKSLEDENMAKKKKKKEEKRLKKKLERELSENKVQDDQAKKRKLAEDDGDNGRVIDEAAGPQKKKSKESTEETGMEPSIKKQKKKKSKKSKEDKLNKDDAFATKNNKTEINDGTCKNVVGNSIEPTNSSNADDVPKKKKKKDKKSKMHEKHELTESNSNLNHEKIESPQINGSDENNKSSFKKDFYSSSYSATNVNNEEEKAKAEKYRKEQRITVYGKGKSDGQFYPIRDFKKLGFQDNLMCAVKNFKEPTPIQASVWPIIASGRDCIGIAETGSGKTLAFSIPALAHLNHRLLLEKQTKKIQRRGPMMLIVAPTRELAQQSQDVLEVAGKSCGIRSVSVYGGVSKDRQRKLLSAYGNLPYEIVVATPGRLIDLMEEGSCDLSDVSYLVLDEADRMLDQGFERDVRKIIAATHSHRQTCLFSATWPDTVRELAHEFLENPMKITIGSDDLTAGSTIEQIVEVFDDERQRQWKLVELLKKHQKSGPNNVKSNKDKRVLIFVLYKKEATRIEQFLQGKGMNVTSIQGDKSQDARQKAVDMFKAGTIPLLVATDVAARGLDIPGVDLVINFSFPLTIEDYVHRIGRTGRAGKKGVAYTFFQTQADKLRAGELVKVLRDAGQPVPEKMLTFDLSIRKKEHKLYGQFGPKDYNNVPMKQPSKIVFGDD